jgi:YbbR domain-containing protein
MKERLRYFIGHNFGLKLISLALATGLWLAVSHDPTAETAVEVPIEFRNVPNDLEISSEHIPQAQIRLGGPERLIRRLQAADVQPEIDLTGAAPGERTFDLTAEQVHKPYGVDVLQVIPGQLHLKFDTRYTRQVEIHPRVVGTFATGYSIAAIEAVPSTITITGPRQHVEAVEGAITDPVDASGIMDRATFATHAYVGDPLVQVVDPGLVRVIVNMRQSSGEANSH